MAHELEIVDGKASMAYAGETPWHGLGVKVPSDLTPEQMMKAANLDWDVSLHPLYATVGKQKVETGRQALIRSTDNKVFDVVTDTWVPVQNAEVFNFFDDFCRAGDMEMDTAGALFDGQTIWGLAKIKDGFSLFEGKDVFEQYMLISSSHKYGSSVTVRSTNVRVVCNNTLTLSLHQKSSNEVRLDHRRKFDSERVKTLMGVSHNKLEQYKQACEFLSQIRYTPKSASEYLTKLFPMSSDKDELSRNGKFIEEELMETQAGVEFGRGTFYQLFNAVTNWTTHHYGRTQDARLQNQWFGNNRELAVKALKTGIEMADAAR